KAEEAKKAVEAKKAENSRKAAEEKYTYVPIKYVKPNSADGMFSLEPYHDIVTEQTLKGYHYIGYVPTELDQNGNPLTLELVFEKDQK
ncbi:MAG: hypothetical protein IKD92_07140, partial [Lachnospiraceae bacterium]|nr:hypothetical protein [Lachnospiraceae bacterium]